MDLMADNPVFVALDVDDREKALALAESVGPHVGGFKVGPRLSIRYGESFLKEIAGRGPLFVDNKYLDIPNTMYHSVKATFESGASFCTVHAWAGTEALRELAKLEDELNQIRPFKILVVTILTSFSPSTMPRGLEKKELSDHILGLAQMSYDCGLKNFVCSPLEVRMLRVRFPDSFLVTPGIRFQAGGDDQKRTANPTQAMEDGANALVIGRPIYQAEDPLAAAKMIENHLKASLT